MQDNEHMATLPDQSSPKKPFLKTNLPLVIASVVLIAGSFTVGYTVGNRQGLTVVGYDADAAQLVEVVQKQKNIIRFCQ